MTTSNAVADALEAHLPCIYCDRRGPRTAEHVLQAAFGGPPVVLDEDVCGLCNGEFSAIDTVFAAFVRTLSLAATHPDQRRPLTLIDGVICFWLNPLQGVYEAVRAEGTGPIERRTARVFPQLSLVEGEPPVFRMDGRDGDAPAMLRTMIRELHAPGVQISAPTATPDLQPPPPPMIVRSAPLRYVIIAQPHDEQRILRMIASPTFDVSPASPPESAVHPQPFVHGRKTVDTGAVVRAVAKVAVNFVCKVLGRDAALSDAVAPLRRISRGMAVPTDISVMPRIVSVRPDVAPVVSVAPAEVPLLEDLAASHSDDGQHALLLLPQGNGSHVFLLALYGKPVAVLMLQLPRSDGAALVIDYRGHTSHAVRESADAAWFRERTHRYNALRLRRASTG